MTAMATDESFLALLLTGPANGKLCKSRVCVEGPHLPLDSPKWSARGALESLLALRLLVMPNKSLEGDLLCMASACTEPSWTL